MAKVKKKKIKKQVAEGIVHIQSTFNNTIITITDRQGNTIASASGGTEGFKGTRKGTPYAAQLAMQSALKKAQNYGLKEVWVYVKGPGPGREAALRALQGSGLRVTLIKDVTPIPHDGCRPPKRRRV
ncbi:MAG: 30S ribosomal protein S11 [Caldimicrobium sp.]